MASPPSAEDERKARLAAALRENLKRRKAQARGRRAEEGQGRPDPRPDTQDETTRS